jgi:hypothetical protein
VRSVRGGAACVISRGLVVRISAARTLASLDRPHTIMQISKDLGARVEVRAFFIRARKQRTQAYTRTGRERSDLVVHSFSLSVSLSLFACPGLVVRSARSAAHKHERTWAH